MRTPSLAAFTAFALLVASSAEAFRVQPLSVRSDAVVGDSTRLSSIAALGNGGFVLAAEDWGVGANALAVAQVFGPGGRPVGGELRCGASPTTFALYRTTVVPDRDGFVFACQTYHRGNSVVFRTEYRRYDARGNPMGDTVFLDDVIITELQTVVTGPDGTVLLILAESDGVHPGTTSRAFDRFDRPLSIQTGLDYTAYTSVPLNEGFLVTTRRSWRADKTPPRIRLQRFAEEGTSLHSPRFIGRPGADGPSLVRGPGGRIAASWSGGNRDSGRSDVQVVLIDADGRPGRPIFIPVPHVERWEEYSSTVLPLDDGLVLVWSSHYRVETENGYVTSQAAFAQRYSNAGFPVGKTIQVGRQGWVSSVVAYQQASHSYLLTGSEDEDAENSARTTRLWRLNLGSTWGKARD